MSKFILAIVFLFFPILVKTNEYFTSLDECEENCGGMYGGECKDRRTMEELPFDEIFNYVCLCKNGIDGKSCEDCGHGYFGKNCAFQCPHGYKI